MHGRWTNTRPRRRAAARSGDEYPRVRPTRNPEIAHAQPSRPVGDPRLSQVRELRRRLLPAEGAHLGRDGRGDAGLLDGEFRAAEDGRSVIVTLISPGRLGVDVHACLLMRGVVTRNRVRQ